ncbi:AbrB family transcriptional regulator [Jeotgalibacillus soli]|nr:AbrB family transcriptional regulator [Jeotgalibacillus soli]
MFSFFLAQHYHLSPITSFLSLAPGGLDQMGIIAYEVNADLTTVTSYQVVDIVFIYIVIPTMLKMVLLLIRKKH